MRILRQLVTSGILSRGFFAAALTLGSVPAVAASLDDVRNFHEVTPAIFRSGHLDGDNFVALHDIGVKTVVSFEDYLGNQDAAASEQQQAQSASMNFSWLPMDGLAKPSLAQLNQALAFIVDPANQPVLVHCLHGSDRTGMVIAAYRMKYQHWTYEDARAEMYQYGHSVWLSWWDDLLLEVH